MQVRYAPCHAVEKRERVADFQETLAKTYIGEQPQRTQTVTLQFGPSQAAAAPPPIEPETLWPFRDDDRGWSVALSSSSLALEASTYRTFDDFAEEFRSVLDALCSTFSPTRRTRLGVRYINELDGEGLVDRLGEVVNESLLLPVGSELGRDVEASISDIRFIEKDGTVAIKHGLIAPDKYLLDFDYYSDEECPFERDAILERVWSYHDLIERLFVWSLAEGYLTSTERETSSE